MFFFLTGYLFNYDSLVKIGKVKYIRKIFVKFMVPYFFFSVVNTVINFFRGETISALITNVFLADLSFGTIWYLPAIFITLLIFVLAQAVVRNNKIMLLVCGLIYGIGVFYVQNSFLDYNYFRIKQALVGVLFVTLGYLLKSKIVQLKLSVGFTCILLGGVFCYLNELVHVSVMEFGNVLLAYLSALLSIVGWIVICKHYERQLCCGVIGKIVCVFGDNSLVVMCTHYYIVYYTSGLIISWLYRSATHVEIFTINFFVSIVLQNILIHVWKWLKRVNRKKKDVLPIELCE